MNAARWQERSTRYVDAALQGILEDVRAAARGGRNGTLNAAAHRAGRLVAAGVLQRDQAAAALMEAAAAAGLHPLEARTTINSGILGGLRAGPAELPPELQGLAREQARVVPLPPSEKTFPPAAEVAALCRCSLGVWGTPVADELRQRGLDPAVVEDEGLARALPPGPLPRWARSSGGSWCDTGHHLVLPLYDARGRLASVHARTLRRELPAGVPKGLSPAGCTIKGLALADQAARHLLAEGAPPWWDGRAILAEGVPDWMTLASLTGEAAEQRPAVLGYLAGTWTLELAQRIPMDARVILWPHDDDAGQRMAFAILATLAHCSRKELVSHGTWSK